MFIATGTNLGNRLLNLQKAKSSLLNHFTLIKESRIYESPAIDYLNQPDFYNQVLEFNLPSFSASEVMNTLLQIEQQMGRNRDIPKGPRIIDLDILFFGDLHIDSEHIHIPHPRLFERSFVVLPLSELPGFKLLQQKYNFRLEFTNSATPLS
jgi:2-amino-4-hydroxy-6-hydroxymethyldihydropteridine diphosphokinase